MGRRLRRGSVRWLVAVRAYVDGEGGVVRRERLHGFEPVTHLAFRHALKLVRDGGSHNRRRRLALLALLLQRRWMAACAHGGRESGMVLGEGPHLVRAVT